MAKLHDLYRERLAATGPFGVTATLGMTMDHFEPGLARVSMAVTPAVHNPSGTLHGGVYCDIADHADDPALRRFFARSPVPFATLAASPDRFAELRDLHDLDFGRGFLGVEALAAVLGAARLRVDCLRLIWRSA